MKAKAARPFQELPKDYENLCRVLLPRPVRDAIDYENISELTDAMVLWQDDFTPDQRDYFDLLCSLLQEYDSTSVKWPKLTGLDLLKHLMEAHELSAADLSRLLGASRNLGAMILRGERKLSLEHIRELSARFKVGPELFVW
jgi:HTH-type transcriptional regulator / antitoxin HigA